MAPLPLLSLAPLAFPVLAIWCITMAAAPAADTLLFENLNAFTSRLPVGDPAAQPTNSQGIIIDGPKDIAVADLDNDGHADFAAANKDGTVTVYFGQGAAEFGSPAHLSTEGHELRGIVLADFTGDGRRDIAVAAPYEGLVYLLVNQGMRQFAPTNIPAWHGARDLAAGDFDGDGLIDLAVAGTTNGVAHLRNTGGGVFEVKTNVTLIGVLTVNDFPQPAFYLKSFRPPGATRDELAAARAQRNRVYVLAANAEGALAVQNILTNIGVNALDVGRLLHPATNDVPPDLIVSHNDRGVLEIHAGVGNISRFTQVTNQQLNIPGGPRNVRIVDLDDDGWNDLVVVQQRFNQVLTFRNVAGVFVATSAAWVGARPREMDLGDFDEDGYPDVAVLNRYSSDVSILQTYPGVVGFRSPDSFYPVDGEVSGLEVRDFNDDGQDDVIQLHRSSGELSVRLAETNGLLGAPTFYGLGLRPIGKVVADVNEDGIPDLITADFTPYITVKLGLGDGIFGASQTYGLPDPVPTSGMMPNMPLPNAANSKLFSVEAADIDSDGHLDVIVGFWDCRLGFFKGNGHGAFSFTQAHVLFSEPRAITAGDYDQDSDNDVVCASLYGEIAVIGNVGDLITTTNLPKSVFSTGIYNVNAMKAKDFSSDGDLDLLIVGSGGAKLYVGGPGLTFTESTNSVGLPGLSASSVATADFNGDGFTDIATACAELACVSILLGSSNGSYTPLLTAQVPASRFIATGDVDGDGLPDLIGTGEALWVALSGHLVSFTNPPPLLPSARAVANFPVINELLAANSALPLAADGNRNSDWVEIFNGANTTVSLADWRLVLITTNVTGITITNEFGLTNQFTPTNWTVVTNIFVFPQGATLEPGAHQLIVCVNSLRSPFHTGFNLPAAGGTLCLFNNTGEEVNRVEYPPQQSNISFSRFRDGMASFMACNFPTPGSANGDSGAVPPTLDFDGVDLASLKPNQPIRFFARSTDDVGVMGVTALWRRLDLPNSPTNRLILADDGMSGDGAMLDGVFSGVLPGLPAGAEIEFYLETMDISEIVVTAPGNPSFAQPGQPVSIYSLAVGVPTPPLEISEVVADNKGGFRDENNGSPDWIEIRNVSTNPVPLTAVSLSQSFFATDTRLLFTNVTLAPGQHHVIFADNNPEQGTLHAPFQINKDGDRLALTGVGPNGGRTLIDSISFGPQVENVAWARLGAGGPWRATRPTPLTGNVFGPWTSLLQSNVFILGFPATNGFRYTVEYTDDVASTNWTALPAIQGSGIEQTISQPMQPHRFLRVRRQP